MTKGVPISSDWWVYFIRPVGSDGPIKIGVSRNPKERLHTYSTWSPVPLEFAAVIAGPPALERRFHAMFVGQHSHHEWFRPSAEMTAVIDEINAGTFDTETLPRGVNLYFLPLAMRQATSEA